jgi:hypothetical protein
LATAAVLLGVPARDVLATARIHVAGHGRTPGPCPAAPSVRMVEHRVGAYGNGVGFCVSSR